MKRLVISVYALSLVACGTIAGNPKKPKPEDTPQVIVHELPTIDFDLEDETLSDDSDALLLAAQSNSGDKTLFNAYGRRFNGLLREVNATSKRINKLAKEHGEGDDDGVVRFKNLGAGGLLAAKVGPSEAEGFDYEVVVCASSRPLQLLRWNEAGSKVELWRDFSISQADGDTNYSVTSRIRTTKDASDDLALDVASVGTWSDNDDDADDGGGIAERIVALRNAASGEIELKAVTDRFTGGTPTSFEGDTYLTSRLYPRAHGEHGFEPSFIGYSKAAKRFLCRAGFDEEADDLWHPGSDGPRFCLGRQRDGGRFRDLPSFAEFVAGFESIGIVRKAEIESVALPTGLSCE